MRIALAGLLVVGVFSALPPAVPPGEGFWMGIAVGACVLAVVWYVVLPFILLARGRRARGER
jgi:threonine/homoserine/homoserine lactone efflux protein